MSLHIRDDFKPGAPISQVPASWFNKVANFINNLVGVNGVKVTKNENGPSYIELSTADGHDKDDAPATETIGEVFTDEVTQTEAVLWDRASSQTAPEVIVIYKTDMPGVMREAYAAKLVFNPAGVLDKIVSVENGGFDIG